MKLIGIILLICILEAFFDFITAENEEEKEIGGLGICAITAVTDIMAIIYWIHG